MVARGRRRGRRRRRRSAASRAALALRTAPLGRCPRSPPSAPRPVAAARRTPPAVAVPWYGTTNAAVLLFVGALLHLLAHWRDTDRHRRGADWPGRAVHRGDVVFGFGSAMSVYHQAALAAALMWCAAAAVVRHRRRTALRAARCGGRRCVRDVRHEHGRQPRPRVRHRRHRRADHARSASARTTTNCSSTTTRRRSSSGCRPGATMAGCAPAPG